MDVDTPSRNPKIRVQECTDSCIKFVLSNTDLSVANSLRRVIISEVPTVAIDFVTIISNTSPLADEFIAHRLGLIPLISDDVSALKYKNDCGCPDGGCENCQATFELNVRNTSDETMLVTSRDLITRSKYTTFDSQDFVGGNPASREDPVLIAKLGKNQSLHLTAIAVKGIGKMHAKWCPVAVCTFQQDPIIRVDSLKMDRLDEEQKKAFVKSCPAGVFAYDEHLHQVNVEKPGNCMYCMECVNKAQELNAEFVKQQDSQMLEDIEDLVKVEPDERCFNFTVESTGARKAKHIVSAGIRVLMDKINVIESEIANLSAGFGNMTM